MTRILPGVYASIFDLSVLPEGESNLTAGYVLRANRGPVNEASLVTNSTSFLNRYTFKGYPDIKDDPTYWTILRTLAQTNQVYVSRVSKGALYGGLIIRRDYNLGEITTIVASTRTITYTKDNTVTATLSAGDYIRISGTGVISATNGTTLDGSYKVESVNENNVVVEYLKDEGGNNQPLPGDYTSSADKHAYIFKKLAPLPLKDIKLGTKVTAITASTGSNKGSFTIQFSTGTENDNYFRTGDRITIADYTDAQNVTTIGVYTVDKADKVSNTSNVTVTVNEEVTAKTIEESTDIRVFRESIANPDAYKFNSIEELCLLTGADAGDYNGEIEASIISSTESPDVLGERPETGAFQISLSDAYTGVELEQPWLVSRIEGAKALDGTGLYIEEVINGNSAYIRAINNTEAPETLTPGDASSTQFSGGYNGEDVDKEDYTRALKCFADKTISVSIIGNGLCEDTEYQKELIALPANRLDCVSFINSRYEDEKATDPDVRVNKIINHKKELGTNWTSTMYAPHVYINDVFNSRQVRIGADGVAIPGWLRVIRESGYPYAFAGPSDGLVQGVTCKWKIGDMSGQAESLNDASINYIAYDAKVGRYYMQCQNTLQVANSALRNLGTVFNILDIKETFVTYFKEYLQKPITNQLRTQILDQGRNYMRTVLDANRVTNFTFADVTTDVDLSNNTLRYLLVLAPTPYAQKIYLTMNIVNQTYDFSITQGGEV